MPHMRVSLKILFTMLFVAVLPVTVSGLTSVLLARDVVSVASSEKLESEARHLAELAETTILGSLDDLRQASNLGLHTLSRAEIEGALWVIYRGDAARAAVALIDGATGESVGRPVFLEARSAEPGLVDHEPFPASAIEAFAKHVPLAEALAAGKAVSVPYADEARGAPLIALAVRVPGPKGPDGAEKQWVVAAELSLASLNQRFEEARDEKLTAYLLDLEGRAVCHTDRKLAVTRADVSTTTGALALADPRAGASGVLDRKAGGANLVAFARASRLASPTGTTWGVVVERDRKEALAAVEALSTKTMFWVFTAMALAIIAGVILARGIARPIEVLTSIVEKFGKSDHKAEQAQLRAPALGADEIGVLARSFNQMADDIEDYTGQLRSFNEDLKQKVEDRTRELKEAQQQLIQSQKMAAVGELGAGVAHEINNPLAGVLGSAQLALLRIDKADARVRPHLVDIEKEALRIKDIVDSLLKLSQEQGSQSLGAVDVNATVEGALALLARPIIAQRIQVKKELGRDLPKIRGRSSDLQQAIMQLLTNAKDAMPDGGTLTLRTEDIDGRLVKLTIEDTGHGIPDNLKERVFEPFFTTRASKGHKGMGLAIVHRVAEEHQGRVHIDSYNGKGATIRLTFPASREALHLV